MKHQLMKFLVLGSLLPLLANSQPGGQTISGVVTSDTDNEWLEGVQVTAPVSGRVSGTQADGVFYITVSEKDSVLKFNLPGYESTQLKLTGRADYTVKLRKAGKNNIATEGPAGKWRGSFTVQEGQEVPFNFEIALNNAGIQRVYFLNGDERFDGGSVRTKNDTLFLLLEPFEKELYLTQTTQGWQGALRNAGAQSGGLPVKAQFGNTQRFAVPSAAPVGDISGTYAIEFAGANGKTEQAVGLFTQEGSRLKATFLRITGDSRYLEGVIDGNNFVLSSFIGNGPGFYKGSFDKDKNISGAVIGQRGSQPFTGKYDEQAALPDPYGLTALRQGYSSLSFSFPSPDGKQVSLDDAHFKDKVVVLSITGSWCPNCMDESAFLAPWYKANKARGVEIIAIHYERRTDTAYAWAALNRFRNKFDIRYTQVLGGRADKQEVAASLPALNTFLSFPTLIFIDKKGKVAKIHTGFSGPATGRHYTQFIQEFNEEIDRLVNNKL